MNKEVMSVNYIHTLVAYGLFYQEAAWEISPGPPPSWPDKGQVEFRDFQVRYREGLDLVLKGVSFTVNGGEKVTGCPYSPTSYTF